MRGRGSEIEIDLFPFLSILVCMIGVLTLLIIGIVLSQINPVAVAEVTARVNDSVDLSDELKALDATFQAERDRLKKLEKQPAIIVPPNRLVALDNQVASLTKQISDRKNSQTRAATEADRIQERVDQLKLKIAELKPTLEARQKHITKLEAELAKRKNAKKGPSVRVLPAGTGSMGNKRPAFVDCNKVGVTIHTGGKAVTIQRPKIAADPNWNAFVKKAAASKNDVIVFLVRRDGIGTFHYANRLAESGNALTGKIPVAWDGELDLSLFQKGGK